MLARRPEHPAWVQFHPNKPQSKHRPSWYQLWLSRRAGFPRPSPEARALKAGDYGALDGCAKWYLSHAWSWCSSAGRGLSPARHTTTRVTVVPGRADSPTGWYPTADHRTATIIRKINRVAIDFNHRHHLTCIGWGRTYGPSSRMR